MRASASLVILAILALASLTAPARSQPLRSELQVNTYTTSAQRTASYNIFFVSGHLAADASGNFVSPYAAPSSEVFGWKRVCGFRRPAAGLDCDLIATCFREPIVAAVFRPPRPYPLEVALSRLETLVSELLLDVSLRSSLDLDR